MSEVTSIMKASILDFYGQPGKPANPPFNEARMYYDASDDSFHVIDTHGVDLLGGGGSTSFSSLTSGTNTTAALVVGSGASILITGSGIVEATQIQAVVISAVAPSAGQVLTATSAVAANWQTPSGGGGVPSGTPLMNLGNTAPIALGSLGAANTLCLKIPGRSLNAIPATFKVRIRRSAGSHFSVIAILRTAIDSIVVIDATPVTFGGSASPTMALGLNTSDAIALPLDTTHDYYVYGYNDSGNSDFWGIKPAINEGASLLGVVGGYLVGDQTAAGTITVTFQTGFGMPWDAVLAG